MVRSLALAALAATGVTARTLPVRAEPELFTVEVSPGDVRQVTEEGKFELVRQGEEFIDITDHPGLASAGADSFAGKGKAVNYPGNVTHQAAVEGLIADISLSNMEDNLIPYTEFPTRYYTSQDGADASDWLLEKVRGVLGDVGSAEPYEHRFVQNSIIATIPGKSDKKIVVGGHLDSINGAGPSAPAPGADDNGSGTFTILESMRVLLTDSKIAGGEAEHTIEFHWYAGEEAGLLGSADIFDEYAADGAEVVAMLQQDMTGFVSGDGAMGVITDFVDSSLTSFVKKVIDAYTEVGSVDSECGYGCSDHASATQAGFPSAFVIEAPFEETNQQIHTAQDTLDKVSIEHMAEHAKMVVGFVYELAFAAGL